jgi:hypothetical protein
MIPLHILGGLMGLTSGAVALLAAFGDVRMLLARGISWPHRMARHLWRMCFALWILPLWRPGT